MTKETKRAFDDRFAREMTETADGMRRVGVMDEAAHKLTKATPKNYRFMFGSAVKFCNSILDGMRHELC